MLCLLFLLVSTPIGYADDSIINNLLHQGNNSARANAATHMHEGSLVVASFNNTPGVGRSENSFRYWHSHPYSELKKIAEVAVGLPVTQANVERTLSGLRFIVNEQCLSLQADIIDAITLLHCNT